MINGAALIHDIDNFIRYYWKFLLHILIATATADAQTKHGIVAKACAILSISFQ